jgi:hypothetical protein
MQKVDPRTIRDNVISKHFETIKQIQKPFIDSTNEEYPECSPYAAFIAWASQFIVLCKDTQIEVKCTAGINSLKRDMEQKKNKKAMIQSILDNFIKDGYISFIEEEIRGEEARVQLYEETREQLIEETVQEQKHYVGFEREYFSEMEQQIIRKKIANNLKKALAHNKQQQQ